MKRDMVAGLIIKDNKLLLVHNIKHGGLRIEPPGGKKETNETWEEAIAREIKEELNLDIVTQNILGIYNTNSPEGEFRVKMFFCKIKENTKEEPELMEPDKIGACTWYTIYENRSRSKVILYQ